MREAFMAVNAAFFIFVSVFYAILKHIKGT